MRSGLFIVDRGGSLAWLPALLASLVSAFLLWPSGSQAEAGAFESSPFWRASAGWWHSTNTYAATVTANESRQPVVTWLASVSR